MFTSSILYAPEVFVTLTFSPSCRCTRVPDVGCSRLSNVGCWTRGSSQANFRRSPTICWPLSLLGRTESPEGRM